MCLAIGLSACAPWVAEAPFSYRSDSAERGDLLGPFDGRVTDSGTGKPVSGALVYATWTFESGYGFSAPSGSFVVESETDSDGRYYIKRLSHLPGPRSRIVSFRLIIYKPQMVAYRSDRYFQDLAVRRDFTQSGNDVKLERFMPGLSHVRHVRFVGGGGGLRAALQAEVVQASLELSESHSEMAAEAGTSGQKGGEPILSAEELRAATGIRSALEAEPIATGADDGTQINGVRFVSGKDIRATVIMIKSPSARANQDRWSELLTDLPNAEERGEVGDKALSAGTEQQHIAAALLGAQNTIVQLSCAADLCRDRAQAMQLLKRVVGRVVRSQPRGPDDLEPINFDDDKEKK
jgi:hypothetical protein